MANNPAIVRIATLENPENACSGVKIPQAVTSKSPQRNKTSVDAFFCICNKTKIKTVTVMVRDACHENIVDQITIVLLSDLKKENKIDIY